MRIGTLTRHRDRAGLFVPPVDQRSGTQAGRQRERFVELGRARSHHRVASGQPVVGEKVVGDAARLAHQQQPRERVPRRELRLDEAPDELVVARELLKSLPPSNG